MILKLATLFKNLIIILALIGMVYWFYVQSQTSRQVNIKGKPQEYMAQITITNYAETGSPKEKLQAEYWEFVPAAGRSDLIKPYVTVYKLNGDVWYLSANKAVAWHRTIGDKITLIDMSEGVVIERPALNNATPTKIETLALQYTPSEEMISSKEFVSMQQPGLTINGYGMLGYLDRNWIELHEKITTVYVPG